ncbi:MAG: DUF4258 domain-containing protein [Anaerolineaceae bacterium]|nr:DUF4258 domain-containing protein [Anaerolineaceae bacterium]
MNHRRTTPFLVPPSDFFTLSAHVRLRMAQRNLNWEDIHFVLQNGQRTRKAGVIHVFLGSRDIPPELRKRYGRLEGTIILVSKNTDTIITVYRNRQGGSGHIRRKAKEARKAQRCQPLYPVYPMHWQ